MLGIFAYKNPDYDNSYVAYDRLYTSEEAAEFVVGTGPIVNMHGRYTLWLKWGFLNYLIIFMVFLSAQACKPTMQNLYMKIYVGSLVCSACCLTLSV